MFRNSLGHFFGLKAKGRYRILGRQRGVAQLRPRRWRGRESRGAQGAPAPAAPGSGGGGGALLWARWWRPRTRQRLVRDTNVHCICAAEHKVRGLLCWTDKQSDRPAQKAQCEHRKGHHGQRPLAARVLREFPDSTRSLEKRRRNQGPKTPGLY
jgi:hypothetical protein